MKSVEHSDKDIIDQVHKFATYEDETGRQAWDKIQSYPRQELIDLLLNTQHNLSENDLLRTDIAFTFCNLDYEYQINKQIIVSFFNKSSEYSDYLERPVDRLIRKGDKDLLAILFKSVQRADGSLAEGLANTFAEQMKNAPEDFLSHLKAEPQNIREKVYKLYEGALSVSDKKKVKDYLSLVTQNSSNAQITREMLQSLSR